MTDPLIFSGIEVFSLGVEKLFAVVTDLELLAAAVPDVSAAQRVDERTLRCVVRPGFAFLRGTLKTVIQIAELQPPAAAVLQIHSTGIGATVGITSRLQLVAQGAETTELHWSAEVTELKGLVATLSRPLIHAAAERTISGVWQQLRARLETSSAS
ncbi:MAG TPA: SRPBCC domain-containing protein [Pirellulales bacterium]|nr:SRPBCC domain-containing protein [Pirellulales bacterium]